MCAFLAVLCVFAFPVAAVQVANTSSPAIVQAPPSPCSLAIDRPAVQRIDKLFRRRLDKLVPQAIYTRHAVMVAPTDPSTIADGFTADTYLTLPQTTAKGSFTSTFTRFAVVGHSSQGHAKVATLGNDVCGNSGLTDTMAAKFFTKQVLPQLASFAPQVASCTLPTQPCTEQVSQGLLHQLPFLAALLGPERNLNGTLLPVMLQGQDITQAVRLGDALSYLVQPGGIWASENVLFIFVGDLSEGPATDQHGVCDQRLADVVSKRGVPEAAEYIADLLAGGVRGGCQGPAAAPKGYGPIMAAARVAEHLNLDDRHAMVQYTGPVSAEAHYSELANPVRGYMSAVFWKDTRALWQRLAAEQKSVQQTAAFLSATPEPSHMRGVRTH